MVRRRRVLAAAPFQYPTPTDPEERRDSASDGLSVSSPRRASAIPNLCLFTGNAPNVFAKTDEQRIWRSTPPGFTGMPAPVLCRGTAGQHAGLLSLYWPAAAMHDRRHRLYSRVGLGGRKCTLPSRSMRSFQKPSFDPRRVHGQEIEQKAAEFSIVPTDVEKDCVYGWPLKRRTGASCRS
jgi:hypothetical protein